MKSHLSAGKLPHFEGLRGILGLIVVIHHFILIFSPDIYYGSFDINAFQKIEPGSKVFFATTPFNIIMNGHLAVCIFLGLSGYVLSIPFSDEFELKELQQSFIKRYFRLILPVFIVCITVFFLFQAKLFDSKNFLENSLANSFYSTLFTNNLNLVSVIKMALFDVPVSGSNTYIPVLWTIQIEFLGALLLYSYLFVVRGQKYYNILGFIIIFSCLLISKLYFLIMISGSLIRKNQDSIKTFFSGPILNFLLFIGFLFFGGIPNLSAEAKSHSMYFFSNYIAFDIYPFFQVIAAIFLLILLVSSPLIQKILAFIPLIFLGKLTFSIYLLHLPILAISRHYSIIPQHSGQLFFFLILNLLIIIAISIPFHYFIDKKSINWSKKLALKWVK